MTLLTTLAMALAGGLGASSRLSVDGSMRARWPTTFPWATVVINVTGSFALGLLTGLVADETWRAVIGVGFLGGYTTFSTASFETARLVQEGRPWSAVANGIGTLVAAVTAASLGFAAGRGL